MSTILFTAAFGCFPILVQTVEIVEACHCISVIELTVVWVDLCPWRSLGRWGALRPGGRYDGSSVRRADCAGGPAGPLFDALFCLLTCRGGLRVFLLPAVVSSRVRPARGLLPSLFCCMPLRTCTWCAFVVRPPIWARWGVDEMQ